MTDREQLKQDYDRIKGQMPALRFNTWAMLACTVGLACIKWYFCALGTLFAARFFFGILCSFKDFLRWADMEREKQQHIDSLRPKQ